MQESTDGCMMWVVPVGMRLDEGCQDVAAGLGIHRRLHDGSAVGLVGGRRDGGVPGRVWGMGGPWDWVSRVCVAGGYWIPRIRICNGGGFRGQGYCKAKFSRELASGITTRKPRS